MAGSYEGAGVRHRTGLTGLPSRGRAPPLSPGELQFIVTRRRMGASWTAIGRMLARHGDDVRRAIEGPDAP